MIFQDFECTHGFEKSQAHAREARKMDLCMRTENLDLIMQKDSRVVQMIIGYKSFLIIYKFKS